MKIGFRFEAASFLFIIFVAYACNIVARKHFYLSMKHL